MIKIERKENGVTVTKTVKPKDLARFAGRGWKRVADKPADAPKAKRKPKKATK